MDQPTVREIITGDQYCECGAMYDVTKEELIAVIEDLDDRLTKLEQVATMLGWKLE